MSNIFNNSTTKKNYLPTILKKMVHDAFHKKSLIANLMELETIIRKDSHQCIEILQSL